MANKIIENIQTQLNLLADVCPDQGLDTNKHWTELQQELNRLSDSIERRERFLETSTAISNTVNSSINLDELLNTSINLIKNCANFYYVGVFLLDNTTGHAVPKASSIPLEDDKEYLLDIDVMSTIGDSIQTQNIRLSTDIGSDTSYFKHSSLSDTRSEAVIPLITRGDIIGITASERVSDRLLCLK